MRRLVVALMGLFLFHWVLFAAAPTPLSYRIDALLIEGRGDSLSVSVTWTFTGRLADNAATVVKMSLRSPLGEVMLAPVSVYGKKVFYGQDVASGEKRENAYLYEPGGITVTCVDVFVYEPWMDQVRVYLSVSQWTKRSGLFLSSTGSRWSYAKPSCPEEPVFDWKMLSPLRNDSALRKVQFSSPVVFEGKSTKFDIHTGDNLDCVESLIGRVRSVASSKTFSVKASSLVVYLPVVGDDAASKKRSVSCAQSLYGYMQRAGAFRVTVPKRETGGEDWDGVRTWVEHSPYSEDAHIREVLDSDIPSAQKVGILSRDKPAFWDALRAECVPGLGRAVYTALFSPLSFSKPNFVMPVFDSCPEALQPADFFFLSGLYDELSDDWMNVICRGAQLNPDSDVLNMDAAMGYILLGNRFGAAPYLRNIGVSDEAKYVYALWLYKSARYGESLDILANLSAKGSPYGAAYSQAVDYARWAENRVIWLPVSN